MSKQEVTEIVTVLTIMNVLPFILTGGKFITEALDEVLIIGSVGTILVGLAELFLYYPRENFYDGLLLTVGGTIIWSFVAITFGAPMLDLLHLTLLWALFQTRLTLFPFAKLDTTQEGRVDALNRLLQRDPVKNEVERRIRFGFYGAALGAWAGVFPIPLDWDQPWQAFPITIYYGSVIGWVIGTLAQHAFNRNQKRQE